MPPYHAIRAHPGEAPPRAARGALSLALAGALMAVAVAGCLQTPAPDRTSSACASGPCPPTGNGSSPPGSPPPGSNATFPALATLRWENCTVATLVTEVPAEWTRPYLPQEFVPLGLTFETAAIGLYAYHCARVVFGTHVAENVRLLLTAVGAEPANTTWGLPPSAYDWEVWADAASGVEALQRFGYPAQVAEIRETLTDVPGQGPKADWVVTSGSTRFEFSFLRTQGDGNQHDERFNRWFRDPGGAGYRRVDTAEKNTQAIAFGLQGSIATMEGPSTYASVWKNMPASPLYGSYYVYRTEEWSLNQTVFR